MKSTAKNTTALLAAGLFLLLNLEARGQGSNPFDPPGDAQGDPFAKTADEKSSDPAGEAAAKPAATGDKFVELHERFRQEVEEAEAEYQRLPIEQRLEWLEQRHDEVLRQLDDRLLMLCATAAEYDDLEVQRRVENDFFDLARQELNQEIEQLRNDCSRAQADLSRASEELQAIRESLFLTRDMINRDLLSDNEEQRARALSMLIEVSVEKEGLFNELTTPKLLHSLATLTKSADTEERNRAMTLLSKSDEDWAIAHGTQLSNHWYPLEAIDQGGHWSRRHPRKQLQAEGFFFYRGSDCLEAFGDLGMEFDVQIILAKDWQPKKGEINYDFRTVKLAVILEQVCRDLDAGYVIRDGIIEIVPQDSERLNVALNYELSGLISEQLPMEQIVEVLETACASDLPPKMIATGVSRLMVVATEEQHQEVGRLLAKLPRNF